jgi:hypothetical protein
MRRSSSTAVRALSSTAASAIRALPASLSSARLAAEAWMPITDT